jgi:hypothetical protein
MNAENTVDPANEPADYAADKAADRPCRVRTNIGAMGDSLGNALRMCGERTGERCGDDAGKQDLQLHANTPSVVLEKPRRGPGSRHLHGAVVAGLIIGEDAAKRSQVAASSGAIKLSWRTWSEDAACAAPPPGYGRRPCPRPPSKAA